MTEEEFNVEVVEERDVDGGPEEEDIPLLWEAVDWKLVVDDITEEDRGVLVAVELAE